jgi:hypothetical protein
MDPAQLAWQPVELPPDDDLPPVSALNAVVDAPGLSWYAVGAACAFEARPSDCLPAVLRSEDGVDWSRVPGLPPVGDDIGRPGPEPGMYDITVGGPGLVAVGASYVRRSADPERASEAAVWLSSNGITWERVTDKDLDGGWMYAVTVLPDGRLIAVGSSASTPPLPAAWEGSRDGREWTRLPYDVAPSSLPSFGFAYDVAALGEDPLGVGEVCRRCHGVAFTVDAGRWVEISDPGAFGRDTHARGVAVSDAGVIVAVGFHSGTHPPTPGAWRSKDGISWVEGAFEPGPGSGGLGTVIAVGEQFVADGGPSGLWLTDDGLDWVPLRGAEIIGPGSVSGLAAGADRMVAVGESAPRGGEPAIWVGLPEGATP